MDNPITEGPSVGVQALCGRIMQRFQASGIPGALNLLEEGWEESDLEVAAERLREGFGRSDLADLVLDRLKKIRLDIGAADVSSQIIGTTKQWLDVELTDSEVAMFSKMSLEQYAQADSDEAKAKASFSEAKEHFTSVRTMAKDNRKKALTRKDVRETEVDKHWDSVAQKVVLIRTDTGEEIGRRDPTPQEQQLPLFGG
tara:strand:- start:3175 stop:3771 length:597 start_codon:yes stop_codon:yes gene_type:complete